MSSAYIDASYLASVVGQQNVDKYFCDDGTGAANAGLVTTAINQASATYDSFELGSFQGTSLSESAKDDLAKFHIAWTALHYGARRRPEWRDDQGRAPFWVEYEDAKKYFRELQQARQRSQTEPTTAGANPLVGGNLNSDYNPPTFVFAGTSTKPAGSGGY